MATSPKRVVTGDTPEHGKHLIWDSHTETVTESNGGLAFTLGCAVLEAELTRDRQRFWQVQHPNGVALYHVYYLNSGNVAITRVG
jgi:hypothetical protein